MILTDEEILSAVRGFYGTPEGAFMGSLDDIQTSRAIEAAILAKLASAELPALPEPSEMDGDRWGYTADDMRNYAIDAYAQGAASQLAEKPTAWSVTYNGEHTGNFNLKRYDAEDKRDSLNRVYPNDKREVVELYTRKEASK